MKAFKKQRNRLRSYSNYVKPICNSKTAQDSSAIFDFSELDFGRLSKNQKIREVIANHRRRQSLLYYQSRY